MASTSASRPAIIFSYNPTDPDVVALAAASSSSLASTSRHPYHAGLGAARRPGYYDPNADDNVPVYGPTTHRRGNMRFVPARAAQFGIIPASGEPGATPTVDLKGKGRAVDVKGEEEDGDDVKPPVAPPPRPSTSSTPSGSTIRGLYAGIVGISSSSTSSAPASVRASVAPDPPPPESRFARASSVPVKREDEADLRFLDGEHDDDDVLVLSSDDDSDDGGDGRDGQDDDDLIVLDPLTGLPEARSTAAAPRPRRPQPLLIHELLPPTSSSASTASAAPAPPARSLAGHVPLPPSTPQYGIKPDNPGFRMLVRQGWREGAALGPAAAPGEPSRGLIVPLRAKEKFDRAGLGGGLVGSGEERRMTGRERDERRKERERGERERKKGPGGARGARGMERAAKEEERRRKALIAYMNRP
ncbi:hypothetical protein JCM8208_007794 [Rhodotorula glutinis]